MKTLPVSMLRQSARLLLAEGISPWQKPEGEQTLNLERVHIQRGRGLKCTYGRTVEMDIQPSAQLWYDCRLSKPAGLDWFVLQKNAERVGAQLRVEYDGMIYGVAYVEELCDGYGRAHHVRLELV